MEEEDRCIKDTDNYFYDVFDETSEVCRECEKFKTCKKFFKDEKEPQEITSKDVGKISEVL